ncbi:MAG: DUF2997 domain-containing protein [Planctomycetota bacterium]
METHEFDIAIGPDGKVQVHVKGVKGAACEEYVKLFERILNSQGEATHTNEYYEPPTGVAIDLENEAER